MAYVQYAYALSPHHISVVSSSSYLCKVKTVCLIKMSDVMCSGIGMGSISLHSNDDDDLRLQY